MRRLQIRSSVLAGGAAALLLAAAVPAAPAAAAGAAAPAAGEPSATCASGSMSAERLLLRDSRGLGDVTDPHSGEVLQPHPEYARFDGFDPCAELSWIGVPYGHATHSPWHIMLYHGTEYLGTATYDPQVYSPLVERREDGSLRVDYAYLLPGDEYATWQPSGRSTSLFTWNDQTRSVDHAGEFPPQP